MNYHYTYLIMGALFFAVWLVLFIWRKDTRKEMTVMSIIFALPGVLTDLLYTQDWWHPLTLTGTRIGPEGLLVGFMVGGVASVIYESVFKKRISIRRAVNNKRVKRNFKLIVSLLLLAAIFFGSFYLLKSNSLLATILALIVPTVLIWSKRKDLIFDSIATGLLLVVVASLVYTTLELLTPGWIRAFWYFKNTPNVVIFNLPLDDVIWYFLAGLFIGPLYEYWKEGTLSNE